MENQTPNCSVRQNSLLNELPCTSMFLEGMLCRRTRKISSNPLNRAHRSQKTHLSDLSGRPAVEPVHPRGGRIQPDPTAPTTDSPQMLNGVGGSAVGSVHEPGWFGRTPPTDAPQNPVPLKSGVGKPNRDRSERVLFGLHAATGIANGPAFGATRGLASNARKGQHRHLPCRRG